VAGQFELGQALQLERLKVEGRVVVAGQVNVFGERQLRENLEGVSLDPGEGDLRHVGHVGQVRKGDKEPRDVQVGQGGEEMLVVESLKQKDESNFKNARLVKIPYTVPTCLVK